MQTRTHATALMPLTIIAALAACDGTDEALPGDGFDDGDGDLDGAADRFDLNDRSMDALSSPAEPSFQLYVAHGGDDGDDGRTPTAPLATLQGAQTKLRSYLPTLDRDVEIRISYDAGEPYRGQEVVWTHTSPDHTVSFMPSDYQVGMRYGEFQGRPIFDGTSICSTKAPETDASGGGFCRFFVVNTETNVASRVRFYYLQIQDYTTTGIGLHQSGEGRNVVYGCKFERIGNLYVPDQRAGYTAIGISDSDHNLIRNNRFVDIRNKPVDNRFMHAIYMNVTSSNNTVAYNSMLRISGDPIKVRHYSNHNLIEHNTLRYAGVAGFLDWPEGGRHECFSWNNVVRNNTLRCGYDGQPNATIKLRSPPEPDGGNPLCVALGQRVYASGNTNYCP